MKRRGMPFALFFISLAPFMLCQTTSTAHTTGTCSPAIAGSNNQVSISCTGMSAAKANQMIALMNKILAEKMDLSQVNSKLDEIHEQLGSVGAALNPFAMATPAERSNLEEADAVVNACSSFSLEWVSNRMDSSEASRQSRQQLPRPGTDTNQREAEIFREQYAPRLTALSNRLHAAMPDAPASPDFTQPTSAMEASQFGLRVFSLARQYQTQQQRSGRPVDTALVAAAQKAWTDCIAFSQDWNHALLAELNNSPRPDRHAEVSPSDNNKLDEYHEKLEPRLVAFRDKVGPQVPDFSSGRNYNAVENPRQLDLVCSDVLAIRNAYRQKVANEATKGSGGR
ncbi:hypothetical protein [Silvibacterium acidisoli]|uniref:hypothetical protein n=1 Tax=Acidobacteriaceae bacterium ZG23-2 TaxID=2883246 RepID=UPI00406CE94A